MMVRIHPSAEVSAKASIGDGSSIWQHCVIQDDVQIGANCRIGANVFIENGVRIGNNVTIKNNIALYTGVICEDDVFLGPNCVFTNVINPRSFISRKDEFRPTVVKKGATIGANATIICGHEIGWYAMVGAGAVVTKDIDDYCLAYGNPAIFQGFVCECGNRLQTDSGKPQVEKLYVCKDCGKQYILRDGKLKPV